MMFYLRNVLSKKIKHFLTKYRGLNLTIQRYLIIK